jgi:hypothetical protein
MQTGISRIPGAARSGPLATGAYLKEQAWYYDLSRNWKGGFVYQKVEAGDENDNYTDWDLTGGIFACGDVENSASSYGVWFHALYDSERLYLLARWVDKTPMNNPGSSKGDYGFRGDCLQFRTITAPGAIVLNQTL